MANSINLTSPLNMTNIIKFAFDGFSAHLNPQNGKTVFIPYEYIDYTEDIYNANSFYDDVVPRGEADSICICLNITSNCNLRCRYCFNKEKSAKNLSLEEMKSFIKRVINHFPNARKFFIDLSGSGEPLLELKKIVELSSYCNELQNEYKKEILINFICNGTLLTNEVAKVLRKNNILFGISLDGIKEYHDRNRVFESNKGSFDIVLNNYKAIENKSLIGAGMTYSPSDLPPLYESYLFLDSLFETFSCRIARGQLMEEKEYKHIEKEYFKIKRYIIEKMDQGSIDFLMKITNGDDYFGRYIIKCVCDCFILNRCDAGRYRFSLGSDGNIYNCSAAVGIMKLINNDLKQEINDKYDTCESCYIKHICGGECQIYIVNNIKQDEYMCKLKKKLYEYSLEICGLLNVYYPDLYHNLVVHVDDVLSRTKANDKLFNLYPYVSENYTFTELKDLYNQNRDRFEELYKQYLM